MVLIFGRKEAGLKRSQNLCNGNASLEGREPRDKQLRRFLFRSGRSHIFFRHNMYVVYRTISARLRI